MRASSAPGRRVRREVEGWPRSGSTSSCPGAGVTAQGSPELGVTGPWAGRRLHFVGIGGAGMSGLALIAHRLGASVTGSDRGTSPYMEPLKRLGIESVLGHAPENVPAGAEFLY